eukprot:7026194-Prymnesium_polylepis.1
MDGTWDNSYTHAWNQVRAALRRHVGSCITRRPAFSHGGSPPASAVSRRETPLTGVNLRYGNRTARGTTTDNTRGL